VKCVTVLDDICHCKRVAILRGSYVFQGGVMEGSYQDASFGRLSLLGISYFEPQGCWERRLSGRRSQLSLKSGYRQPSSAGLGQTEASW